jgi:uncharacterized repeat protein (TIGR02543 family)
MFCPFNRSFLYILSKNISLEVSMKQLKPASLWFLTAALCLIIQGAFILAGCGEISGGAAYTPSQDNGESGGKKGAGSGESVAGLSVEFKTQGGSWLQDIPQDFWETVINDDATVNLPSAYIRRNGMILAGWYDKPQTFSEQALENYFAAALSESAPPENDGSTPEELPAENIPEPEPYLLSGEPVPEEGRFTEKTKLSASITLYAWWQQLEANAKVVTFIPYWMEGAQGFKRQAVLQEDQTTYKIAPNSFPKVTGGPEYYHAIDSDTTWWTETSGGTAFTVNTAVEEDMTVYGHWAGNNYTVTFHANGTEAGGGNASFKKTVVYPGAVTLSAADIPEEPEGYTLLGWFAEQKPLIQDTVVPAPGDTRWFKPGITPVTADIDVYGLWQNRPEGSWRVTFKSYFDSVNSISTVYADAAGGYKIAANKQPENVTREHYNRDGGGWYYKAENADGGEDGGTAFDADTAVAEDIVVYAKWTGKTYTVTFKKWNGNTVDKSITYSETPKLPAGEIPAVGERAHYTSDDGQWYFNGGSPFSSETEITGDITVMPNWLGNEYTVTFNADGGNLTSGTGTVKVKYPDSMEANPTMSMGDSIASASRNNYSFAGWYNENNQITENTVITENISVTARWIFAGFKLTFDEDGETTAANPKTKIVGNTVGTSDSNAPSGSEIVGALPAIPKKTNYLFDGWYTAKDGGGNKVTAGTTVTSDTTYYAKWAAVPDDWAYNSDTGGMSKTFNYNGTDGSDGSAQSFKIVVEGKYTFELKGAAGGKSYKTGGAGGLASGSISNLPKNTTLYVYVGGKGGDASSSNGSNNSVSYGGARGWNGGGKGGGGSYDNNYHYSGGGGGGGATDVRIGSTNLSYRAIVAGGGGGSHRRSAGGKGGGSTGNSSTYYSSSSVASGGTQTSGANFGTGADGGAGKDHASSGAEGNGGGGGGWFGGYTKGNNTGDNQGAGGGGGSGFVNGPTSTNSDVSSYKFTDASCTAGEGSTGNGSAKITYTPLP